VFDSIRVLGTLGAAIEGKLPMASRQARFPHFGECQEEAGGLTKILFPTMAGRLPLAGRRLITFSECRFPPDMITMRRGCKRFPADDPAQQALPQAGQAYGDGRKYVGGAEVS
jgi:hypothetical protein